MREMPKYDVTKFEQGIIDNIPAVIALTDINETIEKLTAIYKNEEISDCLSALLIVEKYLFRALELKFFVGDLAGGTDVTDYYFDEDIHKKIIDAALAEFDKEKAERDYLSAVELIKRGEAEKAGELFKASALGGNAGGAFNYGVTLSRGEGCEPNQLLGAFWYWYAAQYGNEKGMANLAYAYRTGQGVCADEMSMLYWYIRAFLAGDTEAAYTVGVLLRNGQGLPNFQTVGTSLLDSLAHFDDEGNREYVMKVMNVLISKLEPYIYNRHYL